MHLSSQRFFNLYLSAPTLRKCLWLGSCKLPLVEQQSSSLSRAPESNSLPHPKAAYASSLLNVAATALDGNSSAGVLYRFNMDDTLLCPLDSRRGVSEVFVKRITVMFAALCLQGHLNSLRGMKDSTRLKMSLLLFFMNPLHPFLTLTFDIGWAIFK